MANIIRTVAQYLGDVHPYLAGDTVTIRDTAVNLQSLTPAELAALAGNNVDFLDSTSNIIRFSVAQLNALSISIVASDSIVLADTGANIAAESVAFFSGLAAKKGHRDQSDRWRSQS